MTYVSKFLKSAATASAVSAMVLPVASAQLYGGQRGDHGIILHDQAGFRGQALQVDTTIPSMSEARFNDKASSIEVISGAWEVCVDGSFRGRCQVITESVADLSYLHLNNSISSVRPAGRGGGHSGGYGYNTRAPIVLFTQENFRGESRAFDRDVPRLGPLNFNDRAVSVKVNRGVWLLCDDADYRGRCEYIDSDVRDLRTLGLRGNISSISLTAYNQRPSQRPGGVGGHFPRPNDGYGQHGGFGNDRGIEGTNTVFFPSPTDRSGHRIRNAEGQATRFCRAQGFDGAAYKGRGGYLIDVLCEK